MEWSGTSVTEYPWGRTEHSEALTYEAQDARPDRASLHGEARITIHLEDRTLTWRVLLDLSSDVDSSFYGHRRELHKDGLLMREKTWEEAIPRDHP